MNINLTWNTQQNLIPLFDLEIIEEEGSFARAKLVTHALATLPAPGTLGIIQSDTGEIFFKGVLISLPLSVRGHFSEIELIAKPLDFPQKWEALQKECRVHPYWDDLYMRPEKLKDFTERQDVQATSLYCDRITEQVSLSDWFEGKQHYEIKRDFFEDTLQIKRTANPLKSCTVSVHVRWVQRLEGVADLSPAIRRAFPHYKVHTYTKNAILDKWPETGKRLKSSGVWILKSELKPVSPLASLYPKYSSQIPLEDDKGHIKPYRVRKYWFKPKLWVGWKAHQKRKETLTLTLHQAYESPYPDEGEDKSLEYNLQNIFPDPNAYPWKPESYYKEGAKVWHHQGIYRCKTTHMSSPEFDEGNWTFKKAFHTPLGNPARASFFLTDRGYLAAEHAMERAKMVLAKSARSLEVSFEGSWDSLKKVTTDSSVVITDPRLPGGEVKGKVVKWSLIARGETGERFGRITLACTLGKREVSKRESQPIPHYVENGYCGETYQIHDNSIRQTPTGLRYFRYDDKGPPADQNRSFLRGIELINGPGEQEVDMHHHKTTGALKKALVQKPTRLRLYFKDLRTKECVDSRIQCSVFH